MNIKTNIHKIDDNGNDSDSESDEDERCKRKKAAIQLEIGDDGRPLLPDTVMDGSLGFDDLHPIVREYMTVNYSSVSVS